MSSIPTKIKEVVEAIGNILNYLNPLSDKFILKDVVNFLSNILNYLNPFSDKFILKGVLDFLSNILNYLNPFSDKFILKDVINFFSTLINYINPFSDKFFLKTFFDWFGSFFSTLKNFIIPTDEQWQEIQNSYKDLGDTVKRHIPFVGLFSEELKQAQATVDQYDFLVIEVPPINFDFGSVHVNLPFIKELRVSEYYEPYRAYVRGFLNLIVVGLAFVYLIKYILRYGDVQSIHNSVDKSSNNGGAKK